MCVYRQLPHAPENPIALLSLTERRAINLTWARAFDGNSPLIRYILEVSENSEYLHQLLGLIRTLAEMLVCFSTAPPSACYPSSQCNLNPSRSK